jgi:hypothetical protein
MEARVSVVEDQEAIHRELRVQVVVLATEHLFAHIRPDLRLEVQDRSKSEIATLATLMVLSVLDPATATERVHAGVNILLEMQTLLRLRNSATGIHEKTVQEIGMSVVQLAADSSRRTGREYTECLLLASSQIAKNTDVLREDVLACADNSDRW